MACVGLLVIPVTASAQGVRSQTAQASRAQVETALGEAEKILTSPGYSSRIRDAKRREIALLRARLEEGDLQPGDQVLLTVQGEKDLTGAFVVGASRTISLPAVGDVSVRGVLRAELQDHLRREIARFIRDPLVRAETTIRLSILGGVANPGFFQIPSEALVGEAIMKAGGPQAQADPGKTVVVRAGAEIISRDAFTQALADGRTLDELSLRAGDEILVGGKRVTGSGASFFTVAVPVMTGVLSFAYLISQVF